MALDHTHILGDTVAAINSDGRYITYSNSAPNLLTLAGAIESRKLNNSTTTVNGTTTVTSTGSTVSDTLAQSAISSILGASGGFGGGAFNIGKDAIFSTIINAVIDGLWRGHKISHIDMPATPLRVWSAIESARRTTQD